MSALWILLAIAFAPILTLGILPRASRRLALKNLWRSSGEFSPKRVCVEYKELSQLTGRIGVVAAVAMIPAIVVLGATHCWLMPIPLAVDTIFMSNDGSDTGSIAADQVRLDRHNQFVQDNGGTRQDALAIRKRVRTNGFLVLAIVGFITIGFLSCSVPFFRSAFDDYHNGLRQRRLILANHKSPDRDRHRSTWSVA